jgi:hypothetical protein
MHAPLELLVDKSREVGLIGLNVVSDRQLGLRNTLLRYVMFRTSEQ